MSHTDTCTPDGHTDGQAQEDLHRELSAAPSLLDPAPSTVAARAGRVTAFLGLPEVRWAALSLACFLLALLTGPGAARPLAGC